MLNAVAVAVTALAIVIHLLTKAKKPCPANMPKGSMGLPLIGQTIGVLGAVYAETLDRWIRNRIHRYGPVSKVSVLSMPIVLLAGPAANKLMFFSNTLRFRTPPSFQRIFGEKSILNLHGDDHRRIRGALLEFLKPDMLKLYIGRIDDKVRQHLQQHWHGRTTVPVLQLTAPLAFDIIASLLFGLETGAMRAALADDLALMAAGIFAVPVNLPFTKYGRSLKGSRRARRLLHGITLDKKAKLGQGKASPNSDLISRLLSVRDDRGEQMLTDEEIVDNGIFAMAAGYDTLSILMAFMVRNLADYPATLATMVQEHEEIARNKADGEALTWEDLSQMKFTWQVAQETLRLDPPVFGNLRTALEDIEFDGYFIPKGWQLFWAANVTHMDPNIFHEPDKFDPSRFGSQSSATPPCSFVPFGGGLRKCPGMEFAKIEMLVTMHYLVRQFTWKIYRPDNTFLRAVLHPSPLDGLRIQLEHKNPL